MTRRFAFLAVLATTAALGMVMGAGRSAFAQEAVAPVMDAGQAKALRLLEDTLAMPDVLKEHPDVYYRQLAINAYGGGLKQRALKLYLYAAGYADKPSQAALASMYWHGEGTSVDRPRAYAWMDLAASRGYTKLVMLREYYWSQLHEEERAQALLVGQEILAEYNDELTMRHLRQKLDRARRNVTGSRLGFIGNGIVKQASNGVNYDPDQPSSMGLAEFYSDSIWNADAYAQLKDLQWKLQVDAKPSVTVGDLQMAAPAGAEPRD